MLLTTTYHSNISLSELNGVKVIVKHAKHTDEPRVVRNWHNEVSILKRVTAGPHMSLLLASDTSSFTITLRQEEGQPLDSYIDNKQMCTIPHGDHDIFLRQMAEALAYLHKRGIVHDDVKPDNIIYSSSARRAVLIDFGAAFDYSALGEDYFVASGTPPYAPPEYLDRKKGPFGDIWGLGITMLFVKRHVELPDGEWILPHALEGGPAREEMEAWLARVEGVRMQLASSNVLLGSMLEKDPRRRISAEGILDSLGEQSHV